MSTDLLKTFPSAAPKTELYDGYHVQDDGDVSSSLYPPSPPEIKPSRAELANDLLQQLDNNCKQGMSLKLHLLYNTISFPVVLVVSKDFPSYFFRSATSVDESRRPATVLEFIFTRCMVAVLSFVVRLMLERPVSAFDLFSTHDLF